jgi:hypothetical protein
VIYFDLSSFLAALVEDGVMLRHHQVTIPGGAPIPVGHLGFVE